jgi:hypothetical protein
MRAGDHIDYDIGTQRGHYSDGTADGPTGGTGFRIDARVFAGLLTGGVLEDAGAVCDEACYGAQLHGIDLPELVEFTQEVGMLDDTVGLDPAAASFDLLDVVPAGSVIIGVQLSLTMAVTGSGGAARVGLGISGDEGKYGMTAGLAGGLTIDTIPDWAALAAPEDVRVYALAAGGAPVGAIGGAGESLKTRVMYVTRVAIR